VTDKVHMIEQRCIVVAIGPNCWKDEPEPRAVVGEKILISKMSGYMCVGPADGKRYRFINDKDVFAGITFEGELE